MNELFFEGWAIDRDYFDGGTEQSAVGVGMRLADAEQTEASFNAVIGRTVTISKGLSASNVIEPVRWRLQQDREPVYGGAVSLSWIMGAEDRAYEIWHFCEADAGGGELEFRARDLPPAFVDKHRPNYVVRDGQEEWVAIYG